MLSEMTSTDFIMHHYFTNSLSMSPHMLFIYVFRLQRMSNSGQPSSLEMGEDMLIDVKVSLISSSCVNFILC